MYKYHLFRLISNKDVIRLIPSKFNKLDTILFNHILSDTQLPDKLDELCSKYGNLNLLKEIKLIDKNKLLRLSSENGHLETVKYLVSVGADVTASGNAAIIWASYGGHTQVVKYLMSVCAKLTSSDYAYHGSASSQATDLQYVSLGATPVHERAEPAGRSHGPADITVNDNAAARLASANGHTETVKYLVSAGADITTNSNYAVRSASANGHIETVKYLVSVGADITACDNNAVRSASAMGHNDVVKYLVSIGADITTDNNAAVRWASESGHIETVKYLVSLGANVTADNNYAVKRASRNSHIELVKYLVSLGASSQA